MIASLLIELNTEELPPKALRALSDAFAAGIDKGLRARELLEPSSQTTAYGAPRRLAVHISQVRAAAPDQPFRQKLMPRAVALDDAGMPTPALRKKLASIGREALADRWPGPADDADATTGADRLVLEQDGKTEAMFLTGVAAGSALQAGLQAALDEALARLPIPKMMSYQLADGHTTVQFARPAHRLVALHGSHVVPVSALGLTSGNRTFGHRFHAPGELAIGSADGYAQQMHDDAKVIVSFDARQQRIAELVTAAAAQRSAQALMPTDLLEEVTALVEWPVVYESGFEEAFLDVPPECLILTMQQNQKYFALKSATGRLLNRFLLVSHIETRTTRIPGLASVVYHNRLGSQLERVERITGIAVEIAKALGVDPTHVERAARLAKADLRTLMVGEFPELQGTMGTYYARHDNEPADVAAAIEEHYRPRFAGDALPASPTGTCVALADKLETLVGLFGIGERPTGDKDPFALRRHALGVLRMLIEGRLALPLDRLLALAAAAFDGVKGFADPRADLENFLFDRLRGLLREQGYGTNEIEAVVSLRPQAINDVMPRLAAVRSFAALPEAASLSAANKRIGNILKKAETVPTAVDPALLFEPAEKDLAAAFARVHPEADRHFAAGDYTAMLSALAPLKLPVDRFFDDVMVNVDDARLRGNRLALLAALQAQMNRVADLSLLAAG
jgi:glycyl-tRNA synthetase beta chain